MLDHTENLDPEEGRPADPYGDVALGVECAWPETIRVLQEHENPSVPR